MPANSPPGDQRVRDERRAPVLARGETGLQALGFREQMEHFASTLVELQPRDRRPVYEITRWLAANWIGHHGPSHRTLVVEVAPSESRLRALVFTEPELDDLGFWRELFEDAPAVLVSSWAHDRRGSSGVWFELSRP